MKQPGVLPGAERHISSRNVKCEEYYTNEWLSEKVANIAKSFDAELYIEPAVGGGAIYKHLPETKRMGVEIRDGDPFDDRVSMGTDFFDFHVPVEDSHKRIVVVGNPPFAGTTQVRFINHVASWPCSDIVVVFILGLSMRKWSNISKLDKRLHLTEEFVVPRNHSWFTLSGRKVTVPTVVQIWKKSLGEPRRDVRFDTESSEFCVLPCHRWRDANLVVKRFASLACVGQPSKDVRFVTENGQVNAYEDSRRYGTVVSKSGAQGTLMLLRCADTDVVYRKIHDAWRDGVFREYTTEASSNVGNAVSINKNELITIYNGRARDIIRNVSYLS